MHTAAAEPKFVYVLLQYKGLDHTRTCVKSLAGQLARGAAEVVIVDNFSSEEFARETRAAFEGMAGVHLLLRPENDGFARGNNAGYRYARDELRATFIAVFNNDVEVLQPDFPERVYQCHRETRFSILGPDIRVADGWRTIHQNPSLEPCTEAEAHHRLARLRGTTARKGKRGRVPGSYWRTRRRMRGLVLHGSALIFSPEFVADFEEPFDPRTFLYEEERILHLRAKSRGHETWYDPSLVVWHRTRARDYKASEDYWAWRRGHRIHSIEVLLEVMAELRGTADRA